MELVKQTGIPGDLDAYICGYIDQTLADEEQRILASMLARNPEARDYFEKVVQGSKLLRSLPSQTASPTLMLDLAQNLSRRSLGWISRG